MLPFSLTHTFFYFDNQVQEKYVDFQLGSGKNHLKIQLLVSTKNHAGHGALITIPSFLSLWT